MSINAVPAPGVAVAVFLVPLDSFSLLLPNCRLVTVCPGRKDEMRLQLCLLLRFCSVINSSGYSLLFKHPMLLKSYLGGVFPQHMLEFTVSAVALQSTFGFFHPQTVVLIRGGFPLLSWRSGIAISILQRSKNRSARAQPAGRQVGGRGPVSPGCSVCLGGARRSCIPLKQLRPYCAFCTTS